jgi:hypothetical protein
VLVGFNRLALFHLEIKMISGYVMLALIITAIVTMVDLIIKSE